ncbi:MAG TPA: tyrosine-type recombinase/integrase [Acidimicrobiia bacterium]|nr:tyrosine-type recombinase/integrase [Acidimicrobiia bacterium]
MSGGRHGSHTRVTVAVCTRQQPRSIASAGTPCRFVNLRNSSAADRASPLGRRCSLGNSEISRQTLSQGTRRSHGSVRGASRVWPRLHQSAAHGSSSTRSRWRSVQRAIAPVCRTWATPHALRRYHASLLIRSAASVKVVRARLGHASAKTTLDVYGHPWPDDADRTRRAVDNAFAVPTEDRLRTANGH